jgi:hypothetical protein
MKEIKKSASFTSKQKGKDVKFNIDLNYSPEYDSFIIKVKEGEGFMAYSSNIERMPLEVIQKLNEMLEEVLIKAGSKTEMEEHKMFDGGNFQSGVYAMGGSLKAHGIEVGDTFVKTISGNIQKVKDKNGKIVYVDLSTGERDSQPPLPFERGGGIGMEEDIDLSDDNRLRVRKPAMPNRKLTNQELAEKHNSSAYEFMTDDKKAFGGSLFGSVKMIPKARKYPNLQDKDVVLKNGKLVKVFSQSENKLTVMEFGKIGSGERPITVDISEVETIYKNGGALVGNQSRIDMNKNGKIDADDFKLLRSSMNGAWRNDHKHVNHNEDYEVRYAKPRPSRTGYKGNRKFAEGGGISNFERLSRVVAKNYEGKSVKPKYQKQYGKRYSTSEAREVGNKVAGKIKASQKMATGGATKKSGNGSIMVLAKKIRKDGESWQDALKRAGQQLK